MYKILFLSVAGCIVFCYPNLKIGVNFISKQHDDVSRVVNSVKTQVATEDTLISIPVIFHVLYSNSAQNIPTASITTELKELNLDFQRLNADTSLVISVTKSLIGNPNIHFYLADTLLTESGIVRMQSNRRRKLYKVSKPILPEKYLNVYIGNITKEGYSYALPGEEKDNVNLCYKWVGGHYRLLTHETGHWLGLYHIFEGGCSDGDDVADTPPQKYATSSKTKCPAEDYDARCNNLPTNYENFMDYSTCRRMFTNGQVTKMRNFLRENRSGFLSR